MRRPTLIFAALIGAALLLSACDFGGSISFKRQPGFTETSGSRGTPVRTFQLEPGGDVLVRINLADQARRSPLLQFELSQEIDLEVLRDSGPRYLTLASSSSRQFFGPGSSGLSPTSLTTQAISDDRACEGSCVIVRRSGEAPYFVLITNTTNGTVEASLSAFGVDFADEFEPSNDSRAGAVGLGVTDFESGAIETLGDVDYWVALDRAEVAFSLSNPALRLVAFIETIDGQEIRIPPGEEMLILPGEFIRVESETGLAAAPGSSTYFIEMLPPTQ